MKLRQACILLLFLDLVFVYRLIDGWHDIQVRMLAITGGLLVAGLAGLALSGRDKNPAPPKGLLDYLAIAMAVVGGNLLYRVLDALPVVDPKHAIAAFVLVAGSFVVAMIGTEK